MDLKTVAAEFEKLKALRRKDPIGSVERAGQLAIHALTALNKSARTEPLTWQGGGDKNYVVYTPKGSENGIPFSRPVNTALFIPDPEKFKKAWTPFVDELSEQSKQKEPAQRIETVPRAQIDSAYYTGVIGFAAFTDLFAPGNRGGPGTYLEMIVGPTVAVLTGRPETAAIKLKDPDVKNGAIKVPTDLSFIGSEGEVNLVVPTKISSRERISQASVHQRILDAVRPGDFRSVLVLGNENNVMPKKGVAKADRTPAACFARDTLVPGTISTYQRFLAPLSALYYLDPPDEYITGKYKGLPPVRRFGELLTSDLPGLLVRATEET